jgi:uncharacterized membrane protein YfcA
VAGTFRKPVAAGLTAPRRQFTVAALVMATFAGLLVGVIVGMTGMGGGALMTPLLVLVFGVEPLTAVSSDIVVSLVIKPIGGGVHWRRGTVHLDLVKWLALGSVPMALVGVLVLRALGDGNELQRWTKLALGAALLLVVVGLLVRPLLAASRLRQPALPLVVKPLATVLIGMIGGLVVGMTSVGSGSLMIVLLLLLYPTMTLGTLVGTDLVQAVPLVASAALGHLLFGDLDVDLTASILAGAVPGVYLGARWSVRAADPWIGKAMILVLTAAGLRLLGVTITIVGIASGALATAILIRELARERQSRIRSRPLH